MHEKETELISALCSHKDPPIEKIKELLSLPLDTAYILGKLIYSGVVQLAWNTICTNNLQGQLNREIRDTLRLLSDE